MGIDQKIRNVQMKRLLTPAAANALIVMSVLMVTTIIIANFCAVKLWNFMGIPVDGGILLFPLTYLLGDLLVEIYGRKTADVVATAGCIIAAAAVIVLMLVALLPDFPDADNSGYTAIVAASGRVFFASVLAFLVSQIVNNWLFEKYRKRQEKAGMDWFWQRAFWSSAVAHVPDIVIFELVAFFGRLTLGDFIEQAIFAYTAAITIEFAMLTCVTAPLARKVTQKLRFRHGERI